MLKNRAPSQGKPNIHQPKPLLATDELPQPLSLSPQRLRTLTRQHPRQRSTNATQTGRRSSTTNRNRISRTLTVLDGSTLANDGNAINDLGKPSSRGLILDRRRFLEDHMCVRAADPKRGNPRPARLPIPLPRQLLSQKRHLRRQPSQRASTARRHAGSEATARDASPSPS